jgi:hypothetical protein
MVLVSVVVGKGIGFQQQLTDTLSDTYVPVTLPVQTKHIDHYHLSTAKTQCFQIIT